ncbi:MAG: 3-methyl-2-oxobutanoate hydroxymethyltransferase [Desulfurococcaceae archaeon]
MLIDSGKVTVRDIVKAKSVRKIVMVTAYDYAFARLVDRSGVDIILVGDSVGMVVHGYPSTHYVDMNMMLLHVSSVARAKPRALIVADMPFLSYEISIDEAVENAGLMIRAGADAVKIEGGSEYVDTVKAMVRAGIPVMGHIGLNPQRSLVIGGYRKRGLKDSEANNILRDAVELEKAGVFSIVIEYTAADVAKEITEKVSVPTICIGSGPYCDGQVLVLHDILGFYDEIPPFAKKYANIAEIVVKAVETFAREVREGLFPEQKHYFTRKT